MAGDELQYHNELVGRIMAYLVERGLSRVDLEPANFFPIMEETRGDEEVAIATFCDVLHWMMEEGLVRVRTIQDMPVGEIFNGVQLTAKAVAIVRLHMKAWEEPYRKR